MANLNLGQDVVNKRERKYTAAHLVDLAVRMSRYGSLININPSGSNKWASSSSPYFSMKKMHGKLRHMNPCHRSLEQYMLYIFLRIYLSRIECYLIKVDGNSSF